MAYSINSPSAQDDYQIDQYRLNRLGGAQQDYQLAQIANDHPDWTPAQVRMAAQGALGGAPNTRLLTGYGLPARYRITGADPQEQPPISAVNPGAYGTGRQLVDWRGKQENAFRLGQIKSAQAQLDKLDPTDSDDADKINELKGRIGALTEEAASSQPQADAPSQLPDWALGTPNIGGGTAGQEAPVYQAGGPAAAKQLSNGGSIYFGPAAGAPAFRVGGSAAASPTIQDAPPSGTVAAAPQGAPAAAIPTPSAPQFNKWSIIKNAMLSGMAGGTPAVAAANAVENPDNINFATADQPAPALNISPKLIKKRLAVQKQIDNASDTTPDYIKSALTAKAVAMDNAATNAPAPFSIGPQTPSDAFSQLPDSGNPAPSMNGLLPKITSQSDYDALPSGAKYVDPNGTLRTKSAATQ